MKAFIGIDIGGTKCAVTLARVDEGIHIIDKERFPSNAGSGKDQMLLRIMEGTDTLLKRNALQNSDIEAIGVSCGGPLDSKTGRIMSPPNLPGWDDVPITDILSKRFCVPCFLQNDANACALVEWKIGAGRGTENMIFLTMGTGMGAGIISGGKLLTGANDLAGEVGHMRLTEEGPEGYGKTGSFEGWCSGGGIEKFINAWTENAVKSGKTPAWVSDGHKAIDARILNEYACSGDKDALHLFDLVGEKLGNALSILADILNPEKIVIGSVFQRAESFIRPAMEKSLEKEALPLVRQKLSVLPAETRESLGDYAAIMTALYALGIDPMKKTTETDARVISHLDKLIAKYPHLACVRASLLSAYLCIRDSYQAGGKLLVCGNGGSCADSEHIVGELMKGFYLKRRVTSDENSILSHLQGALSAIALTGHSALSTAFSNDEDADYVYAQQTFGYGRKGDVLIGISTSGNAKNVKYAMLTAKEIGMKTIALTGGTGGALKNIADISIIVPGACPADVQENHLPVYHTLCAMLEASFFAS